MNKIKHANLFKWLSLFGSISIKQIRHIDSVNSISIKRNLNDTFLPSYMAYRAKHGNPTRKDLTLSYLCFLKFKDDFPRFYKPNNWREYPKYMNEKYLVRSEFIWRNNLFNNYFIFFFFYHNVSFLSFKYHWFDLYYYYSLYILSTYQYFILFLKFVSFTYLCYQNYSDFFYNFYYHYYYLIWVFLYSIILYLYPNPYKRNTLYLFLNVYEKQSLKKYHEMWPHFDDSFRTYDVDWPHLDLCTHIPIKYDWENSFTSFWVIQYFYTIFFSYSSDFYFFIFSFLYFNYSFYTFDSKFEFFNYFDVFSSNTDSFGNSRYNYSKWISTPVSNTAVCFHSFFTISSLFFLLFKINKKVKKKKIWHSLFFEFFYFFHFHNLNNSFFLYSYLFYYHSILYFFYIYFFLHFYKHNL